MYEVLTALPQKQSNETRTNVIVFNELSVSVGNNSLAAVIINNINLAGVDNINLAL